MNNSSDDWQSSDIYTWPIIILVGAALCVCPEKYDGNEKNTADSKKHRFPKIMGEHAGSPLLAKKDEHHLEGGAHLNYSTAKKLNC